MADQNKKVAHICEYCGERFHWAPDEPKSPPAKPIYVDDEGRQFCTAWCRGMGNRDD